MPKERGPVPDEGIYRAILWALVLTVMAGAVFAILGETLAQDPAMVRVGTGVAFVGGGVYAVFRWLGARHARRRSQGRPPPEDAAGG
jgi:hypothetical protein